MDKTTDAPKIEIVNIKPGDTVVLRYAEGLFMERDTEEAIEKYIKSKLGEDVNILFIMDGAEVSIFRKEGSE